MMAHAEPMLDEGSWEDLIPTISFDGEIIYNSFDPTDRSWMQLPSCQFQNGSSFSNIDPEIVKDALLTAMSDDDDLGIYLNEDYSEPCSPMTSSPDNKNTSPASSCASSGVFSSSDMEPLSPLNMDAADSPDISREDNDLSPQHYNYHNTQYDLETPKRHELYARNDLYTRSDLQKRNDIPCPNVVVMKSSYPSYHHSFIQEQRASVMPAPSSYQSSQHTVTERRTCFSNYSSSSSEAQPHKPSKVSHKPPESYIALIARSILAVPSRKALLADIYQYCLETHAYYRTAPKTWKNAIRHNLSVNECFIKNGRAPQGRGFYWSIHPACLPSFLKGDFRRREARQLAVDMDKLKQATSNREYHHLDNSHL